MSGAVDNAARLAELRAAHPNLFFFGADTTPAQAEGYLRAQGWLDDSESVRCLALAGEVFNMNCTLRVTLGSGATLIVKQSRPFVERYPSIAAPVERIEAEACFYQACLADGTPAVLRRSVPSLRGFDAASHVLCMEDVGTTDWGLLYAGGGGGCDLPASVAADLGAFLAAVHDLSPDAALPEGCVLGRGNNAGLRELTWNYVFHLPLEAGGGGVDLETVTPGLEELASELRGDEAFKERARALGRRYVLQEEGPPEFARRLVHGDFFPASWMVGGDGAAAARVIDAEFCHLGLPELDVGFAVAHLLVTSQEAAAAALLRAYFAGRRNGGAERGLVAQMAGVEVMRRLIGLAQLPLAAPHDSLGHKKTLLALARRCVMEPEGVELFASA